MAILLALKDGTLAPASTPANLSPVLEIGRPIGMSLLTFFPGTIKKDWGGKAEIMVSSHIRLGPLNQPAPRRVNLIVQGYDFKKALPITDVGGDYYGDTMLHYSKAYAGQRLGMTLHAVETDKVSKAVWNGMEKAISKFGDLALFASAAPYLAALPIAATIAKIVMKSLNRNDRLQTTRADLYFNEQGRKILQTGRYVVWNEGPGSHYNTVKAGYRLSGAGSNEPNVLVSKRDGTLFKAAPHFVVQLDAKKRKEYDRFEIGEGSAALLEEWGDKALGATILDSIQGLAEQVNDAKHLGSIEDEVRELKQARTDEEKREIKAKIRALANLLTEGNSDLLNELLKNYLN